MSAALDLDDLEGARDEIRDAVMAILGVAVITPISKDELTEVMFTLGSVHATIERAIEAVGEPATVVDEDEEDHGGAP